MKRVLALVIAALLASLPAAAEPVLRLVNFTADWCGNCRVLNPLMAEALLEEDLPSIERVDIDLTHAGRSTPEPQRTVALAAALRKAHAVDAAYLWDWYRQTTGIAVIIAADNGEPISCVMRGLTAAEIAERIRQAGIVATRRAPGTRMPDGPLCPPPTS